MVKNIDVLMIPIGGGKTVHNTMDVAAALQAVKIMRPKFVIPCHYNCPAFFGKNYNPADDKMFKEEKEKVGIECKILHYGDSINI